MPQVPRVKETQAIEGRAMRTMRGESSKEDVILVSMSCLTFLRCHGVQPTRLLCPWYFPGKNTGMGCRFLLQGIFLTQGWSLGLLHWQVSSSPLSHQESPTTAAVAITSLNGTDETITYCTLTMNLALERRDLSFLHSTDARLETQRSEATCLGFYSLE